MACSAEKPNPADLLPQHPDENGYATTSTGTSSGSSGSTEVAQNPSANAPVDVGPVTLSAISSVTTAKATYTVGPGQRFTSLSQVTSLLSPGDVVDVLGDATYGGDVKFNKPGTAEKKIVIRGVPRNGKRPILSGGTNTVIFNADHYVLEGVELTGGSNRCLFHHADDITFRDSALYGCHNQGILGADQDAGSFTMEYVEVKESGQGDRGHSVYMATDETSHPHSVFRMQHCWVHDGLGGNNVKTRAERNEIYDNWIENAVYHELEMIGPDGQDENKAREDSDVVGNVFVNNKDFFTIRAGGDGTGQSNGRYRIVNNTFVMAGDRAALRLFLGIESVAIYNNAFYRVGGPVTVISQGDAQWKTGKPLIMGSNNAVPTGSTELGGLTGTIDVKDLMFEKPDAFDFHPQKNSPLVGKGIVPPALPAAFAITNVLPAPLFEPQHKVTPSVGRKQTKPPSVGAYEPR